MTTTTAFTALVLRQQDEQISAAFETVNDDALPAGDVTVRVAYSTVNYKDGMVLGGLGRLVRDYPHIPGIDFSGVVEASEHPGFSVGDPVVLTGWRVGEVHWGGYAERARVKGDWLIKLPMPLSLTRAMAVGTAGFTAMLAIDTLEAAGLTPAAGRARCGISAACRPRRRNRGSPAPCRCAASCRDRACRPWAYGGS